MDLETFITNLPQNEAVISSLANKLENILEKLKDSQEVREAFIKNYPAWAKRRREIIKELHDVAEVSTTHRQNVSISQIVGSFVGITGGIASIVLGAVLPFSLPIAAAVGISSVVLGGGTTVGSSITERALEASNKNKVKELLLEERDNFAQIEEWLCYNSELSQALKDLVDGNGFQDLVSHFKNAFRDVTWEEMESYIKTKKFSNSDHFDLLQLLKGLWGLVGCVPPFSTLALAPSNPKQTKPNPPFSDLKVLYSIALAVPKIVVLLKKVINYYNICRLPYNALTEGIKIFGSVIQVVTIYTSQGGKIIGEAGALIGRGVATRVLISSAGVVLDAITLGLAITDLVNGSRTAFVEKIQEAEENLQQDVDILDLIYEETKKYDSIHPFKQSEA